MPIYKGSKRIGVLSLGGKEIGKAYLGGVCVFNKEVVYEYDDPIVELAYPTISNTGGEYKPSYSYTQTARGSDGSVIEITSGGNLSWSIANKASDVNFDTTTGEMACSVNSTDSDRLLGTVTLTVSLNGKTGSASYAIYQSAKEVVSEEYSTPSVSLSYSTASATATSLSPSYSYRQTKTTTYSDGSTETSNITSGGSLSWSVSNRYSGATFSSSTGAFSFSANSTTSQITLGTVTLSVALNGKTGSATATAYQAAGTITYSTPSVSLSYPTASATAGTVSPTYSYSQTRYVNGVANGTITSGGTLSWGVTNRSAGFDTMDTNGVITTTTNSTTSQRSICTVTLTVTLNGESGTATTTVYQAAGGVTYEYSTPSVTLTYTDAAATAGSTATPTCTYTQTRTGSDGSTATITSGGSLSYSVGAVYDDYMSYSSSTGVVTTGQANTTTSRQTICTMTVTVQLNGKTGSATATVYQAAGGVTYTYSTPSVSISYDSPVGPAPQYATPTYSYSQVRTGSDGSTTTITSGGSLTFTAQQVNASGVTVDSSTGRLDCPLNDTGSERRLCYVVLEVTLNGETGSASCEVRQEEIKLPEIYFVNLNTTSATELTDSSLISVQDYTSMAHKSGTAMTIGVSLPEGSTGVYQYNLAIWFDAAWNSGNVGYGDPQYQCVYHTGQTDSTGSGSIGGALESIYHGGESGVSYGDGYYRLTISNATLALMSSSSEVELLELDLWHFYTDLIGGSSDKFVRANRYLRLRYTGRSVPTTLDEFIENIRVELVAQ